MIRTVKIINKIERLRRIVRAEGTPAIQEAWDQLEPHVSIFLNAQRDGDGPAGTDGEDGRGAGHLGRS